MSSFESQYKNLNKSQREAVDTIDGPVMVIAGPGTGKTTILTLRIANILKQTDTPAHGIIAITYTDAGVKAMRDKLHGTIGNRAHEVAIHTFHSFASAMIADYPDHFIELRDLTQMTDVDEEILIRNILSAPEFAILRPMGKPDAYISGIMRAISDAKKDAYTPEMVREHARQEIERIKNDPESVSTRGATKGKLKAVAEDQLEKCGKTILLADVYEKYEREKAAAELRDYDDLIISLLVALRTDNLLLRLIQERFLYILVDEHQDTNDSQNFIVDHIAEFFDTPNIFIVGDEKQAIYRFQGASVENFLKLKAHYPAMKLISLDTNYRSHQDILDAAFSMIEHNYEEGEHKDLRIKLTSARSARLRQGFDGQAGDGVAMPSVALGEGGSPRGTGGVKTDANKAVEIVIGENVPAIENYLCESLKKITHDEPDATVAIITRRNRDVERVLKLLESNGIPVSSERSVDIFHHPVGALFFGFLEYLADQSRLDALARTVAGGLWKLSFEGRTATIRALRSGRTAAIENDIPELIHIRRITLNDNALGFLIHAAELSGFTDLVATDPSYVYVWRGIIALSESLMRKNADQSPLDLISALLAYRLSAESKTVKVSVGAPDLPIGAMTAHSSKGLEFDHVFIPYATEESWVGRSRGSSFVLPQKRQSDQDERDIRRLFYVALTRARTHVTVLSAHEESDGEGLTELRFISELDPQSVTRIELPRRDAAFSKPAAINISASHMHDEQSAKMTALAKEVLLDSGLSVTALNHFIDCPNAFLYQSILKLPQAPSAPSEKGNAMHEAISRVWHLPQRQLKVGTDLRQGDPRIRNSNAVNQAADSLNMTDLHAITSSHTKLIEETLIIGINDYLNDSFLSAAEKLAVKNELIENAPIVAKALESHFKVPANAGIFTEYGERAFFDGIYDKKSVRIPIHGKLDAMIDVGNEIFVYDYKTRQAMSENAIRGLVKSQQGAPGSYFRQLVFYKLLLSENPRRRMKRITPALVFVSPDEKGRCPIITLPIIDEETRKLKIEIQSVIDAVWSGEIANMRCNKSDCEWCGLKSLSN